MTVLEAVGELLPLLLANLISVIRRHNGNPNIYYRGYYLCFGYFQCYPRLHYAAFDLYSHNFFTSNLDEGE